jgi:hypothetical protein
MLAYRHACSAAVLRSMKQAIAANEVGADMGKSVIIHLMTDGLPTDGHGNAVGQMEAVKNWIKNRKMNHKALICITLCTTDESIHEAYESLDQGTGVDINAVSNRFPRSKLESYFLQSAVDTDTGK